MLTLAALMSLPAMSLMFGMAWDNLIYDAYPPRDRTYFQIPKTTKRYVKRIQHWAPKTGWITAKVDSSMAWIWDDINRPPVFCGPGV